MSKTRSRKVSQRGRGGRKSGLGVEAGGMERGGMARVSEARALVGGSHAFVLLIARALGLAPLAFARLPHSPRRRWRVAISSAACVASCIVVSIAVGCCLFGLARELHTPPEKSLRMKSMTARVVASCDILAVVATSAVGVYGAPARARRTLRVLRLLASVDNSLGLEILYTQERNSCLFVLTILFFWTCLIIDDFGLYANQAKLTNTHYKLLQNYLAFYLLYYVVMMLEVQFAFTAHAINLRLRRLNKVLEASGRELSIMRERDPPITKNTPIFTIRVDQSKPDPGKLGAVVDALGIIKGDSNSVVTHDSAEKLRILSELHGTLCAAAREVDAGYGLPVLIILISTLLHLIVTPYFLILELGGSHRPHYMVLQALWCMAHGFRLLLLVEPCHQTKKEVSNIVFPNLCFATMATQNRWAFRTGDIVGELLGHGAAGSALLRRLELFSRQLLHRAPNFTALGVCSLDRPLIASVTGAVSTYLVILIQFQKQDDEKH